LASTRLHKVKYPVFYHNLYCLRNLYSSLVHPLLEYGTVIWHPYLSKDIDRIERVQNTFLTYVAFKLKTLILSHNYTHIRNLTRLETFSSRRLLADQHFLKSLLTNSLDAPELLSNINFKIPIYTSWNHSLFYIHTHSTSYGHNHPLHRMLRVTDITF